MNACMTYFAIVNGYTTISIFTIPIGFKYGGWLFSPLILLWACFVETFAAIRLIQAAQAVEIYQYTDLVEYSLGRTFKQFFQIMIAMLHFGYSMAMLAFVARFFKYLYISFYMASNPGISEPDPNLWIFVGVTIILFAPMTWTRRLEALQYLNVYSFIVIFLLTGTIIGFCAMKIKE
jgi:hypothetical protein